MDYLCFNNSDPVRLRKEEMHASLKQQVKPRVWSDLRLNNILQNTYYQNVIGLHSTTKQKLDPSSFLLDLEGITHHVDSKVTSDCRNVAKRPAQGGDRASSSHQSISYIVDFLREFRPSLITSGNAFGLSRFQTWKIYTFLCK